MITINIAKDFSMSPGGRYVKDGPNSAEEFLKTILIPKYHEAVDSQDSLKIILDGGYGYPSSFLDESFTKLGLEIRNYHAPLNIEIVSDEEPRLIDYVQMCILEGLTGEWCSSQLVRMKY